jgi:hypothetical protein
MRVQHPASSASLAGLSLSLAQYCIELEPVWFGRKPSCIMDRHFGWEGHLLDGLPEADDLVHASQYKLQGEQGPTFQLYIY